MKLTDVIRRPLVTEKTSILREDGRTIVFSTNWRKGHGIHLVDAAGGEERALDETLAGACEPRFHPDGRRVVYVSRGGHRDTSRLVEQDIATGARSPLPRT